MKTRILSIIGITLFLTAPVAMAGTISASPPETVDVGLVSLPQAEFEQLADMIGSRRPARQAVAAVPAASEDMGLVEMRVEEAKTLRQMVAGTFTGSEPRVSKNTDKEIQLGLISMPNSEYQALKAMVQQDQFDWKQVVADAITGKGPNAGQ